MGLDVALLFGEERNNEVAALNQGDWVEFEATMTAHGYRGDPEVMTLWHIKNITRPSPLSSSAGMVSHHNASELEAHQEFLDMGFVYRGQSRHKTPNASQHAHQKGVSKGAVTGMENKSSQ